MLSQKEKKRKEGAWHVSLCAENCAYETYRICAYIDKKLNNKKGVCESAREY